MIQKNTKDWIFKNFKVLILIGLIPLGYVFTNASFKGKKPKIVLITTSFGDMKVKLYDDTPIHRDNFLKLVEESYYDSTLFHRVIKGFMIQGGDPNSKGAESLQRLGAGGPGYTLEAEILPQYIHKKGALSAARQGDRVNPEKRSSGSQFYVVQGKTYTEAGIESLQLKKAQGNSNSTYTDEQKKLYESIGGTPHLDGDYTVFGEVIEGLNIIDSIANVSTAKGDRPLEDVIMHMKIVKK
ncbi:MAG: cyclophilin family peptidyl-prolyl cis-trans isomerase [Patiriisocius sp.]|jgi:cyclophilin family peptidyl-prolyl cis-trans isomerase